MVYLLLMDVYIESTIPSYVVARPSGDSVQAARQELTRDWWAICRRDFGLYISEIVMQEISEGDRDAVARRLAAVRGIPLLPMSESANSLTNDIIQSGILPARAARDAAHIAIASVHGAEFLLTWNCKHIANAVNYSRLRSIAENGGFQLPVICTPEELSHYGK